MLVDWECKVEDGRLYYRSHCIDRVMETLMALWRHGCSYGDMDGSRRLGSLTATLCGVSTCGKVIEIKRTAYRWKEI